MLNSLLCFLFTHNLKYCFNDNETMGEFHRCIHCGQWFLLTNCGRTITKIDSPCNRSQRGQYL